MIVTPATSRGWNLNIWSSWALILDFVGCYLSSFARSHLKSGRVRKLALQPGLKSQIGWMLLTFLATPTAEMIQSCITWPAQGLLIYRRLLPDEESEFEKCLTAPKGRGDLSWRRQNSELEEGMLCYDWSTSLMNCIIASPVCWSRLLPSVFLMTGRQLQLFAFKPTN